MSHDTTQHKIDALRERIARIQAGGGPARIDKQHAAGKLTARERLAVLFDPDTFVETKTFIAHRCTQFGMEQQEIPCDGVVTGSGTINGRLVFAFSQDFTCSGGSVGEMHAHKIVSIMTDALKCGAPVIGINDSGGARIQEGVDALSGYGRIFYTNTLLSGVVPQISIIAGACAGGAAYSPAMTDFVIMVRGTSQMFIAGPNVIKAATGESITPEALGGADAHARISGNIHFTAADDRDAFAIAARLLSFLPNNNLQDPPSASIDDLVVADDPRFNELVPDDPREPYDMRAVIIGLVDGGDFLEIQADYAPNLIIGLARLGGITVGVLANQPMVLAGVLDINASDKGARFIRFCNTFNIPLVNLVDVPGFLPGVGQEHGGIIRHGAKLLFSYSSATVPKLTVIIRKAYGGAYLAMCSKDLGADRVYAWPSAEIAVMGAEGAVEVVFRKEIREAADPKAAFRDMVDLYRREFANPYVAAGRGFIDNVIEPRDTRRLLILALHALRAKRETRPPKKHGNIPL
ncbi:MAG TPA: carboxyl transferase domain-containing protein [Acidobacteriota bacterium]|nr:carboxyl transferase domain-containing protein [Acidobacteriota bacterium]HQG93026.1 carboxyl transferase domain-containing protein [Acidobacteriota bacterium]HQK86317.1 carboxyl transferase domain-containing protein [Acidobacteriota bacterium]